MVPDRALPLAGQLYLGGPNDKFTTFVNVKNNFTSLKLPKFNEFEKFVSNIQGLELSKIMDAIILGTQRAYENKRRPFCTITLEDKTEKSTEEETSEEEPTETESTEESEDFGE